MSNLNRIAREGSGARLNQKQYREWYAKATIVDAINQLRAENGSSVTIFCDNEEGDPNVAIEVCSEWTNWEERRFGGNNVEECLKSAVKALAEITSQRKESLPASPKTES